MTNTMSNDIRDAFANCGLEVKLFSLETIFPYETGLDHTIEWREYIVQGTTTNGTDYRFFVGFHGDHGISDWQDEILYQIESGIYDFEKADGANDDYAKSDRAEVIGTYIRLYEELKRVA